MFWKKNNAQKIPYISTSHEEISLYKTTTLIPYSLMKYNTPFHRGYRVKYVTLAIEPCIRVCGTLAETLRNIGGASAQGSK